MTKLQLDDAIRLYYMISNTKFISVDNTEQIEICRICRIENSDQNTLVETPCNCSGSIGHIHMECYKIWRKLTHRSKCEICKAVFRFKDDHRSNGEICLVRLQRFFQMKYFGVCIKRILNICSTLPLIYGNIHIIFETIDALSIFPVQMDQMILFSILLASTDVLLTSYLLWSISNLLKIRSTLHHWWNDIDEDSFENLPLSPFPSFESLSNFI